MERENLIQKVLRLHIFNYNLFNYKDLNLAVAIAAAILGLYVTNLAQGLAPAGSIIPTIVSWVCKILILVALLFCTKVILERRNKLFWGMLALVVLIPIVQLIFFNSTWNYFFDTYQTFLLTIFPIMLCFAALKDTPLCFRALAVTSFLISVLNLCVLIFLGGDAFGSRYSMGYANSLILPTNVLIWCGLMIADNWKKRVALFALAFCNILGVFVYGSRGALAAIAVFCVFLFFKLPFKHPHGRKIKIGIVIVAIPLLIFYQPILNGVMTLLEGFGFYSRTLNLLVNDIGHDSGRSALWASVWADFRSNPVALRGINSDYAVIGIFSHNAFLELLHSGGILLGGILCVALAGGIVYTLFGKLDVDGVLRCLVLFSFFPICLWSNSVWLSLYLWLWVTLMLKDPTVTEFVKRPFRKLLQKLPVNLPWRKET